MRKILKADIRPAKVGRAEEELARQMLADYDTRTPGQHSGEPLDLRSSSTVRCGIIGEAVTPDEKQEKR